MHEQEAKWISNALQSIDPNSISPLLNLGSSTKDFRTVHQPFIDLQIFQPLAKLGVQSVHQDIKDDPGVDLIGNLQDEQFLNKLIKNGFKAILCSNLLEHLEDPAPICAAMMKVIPTFGYILVTVPVQYPKHMDPIDTMFRPAPKEIAQLFSGTIVVDSHILSVGSTWSSLCLQPLKLIKLIARALVPFYRHSGWITAINKLAWIFRERKISCVLLQKEVGTASN